MYRTWEKDCGTDVWLSLCWKLRMRRRLCCKYAGCKDDDEEEEEEEGEGLYTIGGTVLCLRSESSCRTQWEKGKMELVHGRCD